MTPDDFEYISRFVMKTSGLSLGKGKEYLVTSRLVPLAQSWDLADVSELVAALRKGDERLGTAVTEAMTTNETSFYRDKRPFEDFKTVMLPRLIQKRDQSKRLRIWFAACSTGQEPYSITMSIKDNFPELSGWNIEFVATDIAKNMLERASTGIYSQFEVQRGLPIQLLMKHFQQSGQSWQVKEDLRKPIVWKQLNLLEDFSHLGFFDIVFCRNVLIYFEIETKSDVLSRIRRLMPDDGYLLLGSAETVLGVCDEFERCKVCQSAVYQPVAGSASAHPLLSRATANS